MFIAALFLFLQAGPDGCEGGGGNPTPVPTLSAHTIDDTMIPDDLPKYRQWDGICTYIGPQKESKTITYEGTEAYSEPSCPPQGEGWELYVEDWIESK